MSIDLTQLSQPAVIETLDFEALLTARKAALVALYPADQQATITATLELESEPIVRILEEACYRELVLRARYNDEARELMLAYATGTNLDHIGVSYYQEERLLVTAADTTAVPPVAAVYESDADYRQRLADKVESFSVAGPTAAYEWLAKSAAGTVADAKCDSPQPGTSRIAILSTEGDGTPDAALLATVLTALSADTVRPLCEEVLVVPAQVQHYAIGVTLYPEADESPSQAAAVTALTAYATARHKLKKSVSISGIIAAANASGVQKIVVNAPAADISCSAQQAAYCTGITVTVAGVSA
jgi:phage-related baseplate assembly protein